MGFWVLGSVFVLGCFVGLRFSFIFLTSFFLCLMSLCIFPVYLEGSHAFYKMCLITHPKKKRWKHVF